MAETALVLGALFVIELVEAFEGFAAHQAGDKPWLVTRERGQDVDARIERCHQLCVHFGLLFSARSYTTSIMYPSSRGTMRTWASCRHSVMQVSISMGNPDGSRLPVFLKWRLPSAWVS